MARGLEPTDGIAQGLLLGLLISGSSAALAAAAKPGTAEAEKKHLARIAAEAGVAPDAPEARFLFETRLQAIAALPECAVRESDQQRHATCSICLEVLALTLSRIFRLAPTLTLIPTPRRRRRETLSRSCLARTSSTRSASTPGFSTAPSVPSAGAPSRH
mmetsp:Transcript_28977/g.92660  ORF Transcript_28977/g.92660 Transcript_28977/m.92660 type:complete len:160 (+) Transcript_28977:703-1182(+)